MHYEEYLFAYLPLNVM